MQIPIFPVTINDGVPFPENGGKLDIPASRFHFFRTAKTPDPLSGSDINAVVLAFIAEEEDVERMFQDPDVLIQKTCPIGLYCAVEEIAEGEDFTFVSVEALARCYLNRMAIVDDGGQAYLEVELEPVIDDMRLESPVVTDNLEAIINDCVGYEMIFSKHVISRLRGASFLETKLNILADAVITDSYERLKFLQRSDLQDRVDILSRSIRAFKNERLQIQLKSKGPSKSPAKGRRPHSFSAEELKRRIQRLRLPEESMFSVQRELNRLETLNKNSNDYATTADYLNWIASLPWETTCHQPVNLTSLTQELDATHYGLEDVKQDVLEHLALQDHIGENRGSVLCFVGPAGTGKTSIAKEIAAAMGRPLARVALGGVSDENEIRGHRRTYLGSRPGRLIVGIRDAGVKDPLFLLDEVDKMQARHGDPTAALLEALDPEQNGAFVDKYLEIPFDLSQAIFICTANDLHLIPPPLRDRMDVIKFRKYELDERQVIIRDFMIPKALEEYRMSGFGLEWDEEWIDRLAREEDQLRQLDMRVRKVLRKRLLDIKLGNDSHEHLREHVERNSTGRRLGF